jgi:hypothetical protein
MMELAHVFRGDWAHRQGWGWHDMDQWRLFFDTIFRIGQITKPIAPEDVLSNKYVGPANQFDVDRVATDAQTYVLPPEFQKVDVEAIRARL